MGRRHPKSYRIRLTWQALQDIAGQLVAADAVLAAVAGRGELCRSSALYRTGTTGRFTAHLVWREGNRSISATVRNIEVAP
jgi:hypothetical protein